MRMVRKLASLWVMWLTHICSLMDGKLKVRVGIRQRLRQELASLWVMWLTQICSLMDGKLKVRIRIRHIRK